MGKRLHQWGLQLFAIDRNRSQRLHERLQVLADDKAVANDLRELINYSGSDD
jgi:hypothetical protein